MSLEPAGVSGLIGIAAPARERTRSLAALPVFEVQETFDNPPRTATLARWRSDAPTSAVYTMRAHPWITHPATDPLYKHVAERMRPKGTVGFFCGSEETTSAWSQTMSAALALEARAIVFATPAAFTPTSEHKRHFREFFASVHRSPNLSLAWAPFGTWSPTEVISLCEETELLPSFDPVRGDLAIAPSAGAYLRLSAATYSESELAELLPLAQDLPAGETFWVFAGANAFRHARLWQRLLAATSDNGAQSA